MERHDLIMIHQIPEAAMALDQRRTGRVPRSVTVVLPEESPVVR